MIFLYIGLGFGMLTTVVAIFQASTTINKNQYLNNSIPVDSNKILLQKQNNKKFLQMLNDIKGKSLGSGQQLCQNIKTGYNNVLDSNHSILSNYSVLNTYSSGISANTTHSRLNNGCELVYESHRIIIVPSTLENNSYNLYSCIVDIEPTCDFESIN